MRVVVNFVRHRLCHHGIGGGCVSNGDGGSTVISSVWLVVVLINIVVLLCSCLLLPSLRTGIVCGFFCRLWRHPKKNNRHKQLVYCNTLTPAGT